MRHLALLAALLWPTPTQAVSTRCEHGVPCSLSITFTGTVVSTVALQAEAHDGVVVVRWQTTGSPDAVSGERWGFYDRDVMALNLTVTPGGDLTATHLGGQLAWAGEIDTGSRVALAAHK